MLVLVSRALRAVVVSCVRHPRAVVLIGVALAAASALVTATRLRFEASELHLLPAGETYVKRYREYSRAFGELDELVTVVQGRDVEQAAAFAARLVAALRAGPIRFNHLAYRVGLDDSDGTALLYPSRATLERLRGQLYDHQAFLESFAAAPGVVALVEGASREFAVAVATRFLDLGLGDDGAASGVEFLASLITQLRDAVDGRQSHGSPWRHLLTGGVLDSDAEYFLSEDKTLLYILADPAGGTGGFASDLGAVEEIRAQIATLTREFPGLEAGVTGGPALAADGMQAAFHDSRIASALALALTFGLVLLAFRRLREPGIMLGVLAMSLMWSLGLTTVLVGHLTIFSVMFISIVIGLGIDYGIYVLFRCDEERRRGAGITEALEITATRSGPGILLGALTAAATFYVLLATDFHGVQELGLIAGTALLAAFVAMMTVFPAALALVPRRAGVPRRRPGRVPTTVPLLDTLVRRPAVVLAAAGLLTAVALWSARLVTFDYDLLNLQARGAESVEWERRIIDAHDRSSYSALATATSMTELAAKRDAFERLPSVAGVDSALLLLPDEQAEKSRILRGMAPLVDTVRVGVPPPVDLDRLRSALEILRRRIDLAVDEAAEQAPAGLRRVRTELSDLLARLRRSDVAGMRAALERYQTGLARDFRASLDMLKRGVHPHPVTIADVPADMRRKFVSEDGRLLLQIHPKVDVWDRAGAVQFVDELRSVDPDVTGAPVVTFESISRMEAAYRGGAVYALIVVAMITALVLHRLRETVLALTPVALGTLWAIGLMPVLQLKLNLANVWAVPLIIGASAEYGLNVVTRAIESRAHGGPVFAPSTIMAVGFNGLSTITGFGTLMLAHHRGMRSLGVLLTLGSVTSLLASLVVLPAIVRLLERRTAQHTRCAAR